MRILVNFMHLDTTWCVHCLADDCKTLISEWTTVRTEEALLGLLKASGASAEELADTARDMARWGRGNTFIEVNEIGRQLLRIRG